MKNKKILISIVAIVLLAGGGGAYALVKHEQKQKAEEKPVMYTDSGQKIDMSPATEKDNEEINNKKVPGGMDDDPVVSDTVQVTITRASQDSTSRALYVRSLLSGVTGGSCTLTLTKDSTTIQKAASVKLENTGYVCDGFEIPASEFAGKSGTWKAVLTVTGSDNKSNSATQDITVSL